MLEGGASVAIGTKMSPDCDTVGRADDGLRVVDSGERLLEGVTITVVTKGIIDVRPLVSRDECTFPDAGA